MRPFVVTPFRLYVAADSYIRLVINMILSVLLISGDMFVSGCRNKGPVCANISSAINVPAQNFMYDTTRALKIAPWWPTNSTL